MSLKYAIYARKSQEDEGRQVQSIDSQLIEVRRLAEREGLTIVDTFTEARSAWEPDNRPSFSRLVRAIERGDVEGIIAWHPDRLSRNETDGATVTRLLRQGKLRDLKFASYHFFNSPEGIMMLQIALSQSQYQNSKMSVDVRRGMERKRSLGWLPHRAPEGYLNEPISKTIIPDPERFDLLRKGWDLLLSGNYTVCAVIDQVNAMGYRTKQRLKCGGGPLSRSSGYRIFTNPFYCGWIVEKGTETPGKHQAMVTEAEFLRGQDLVGRRRRIRKTKWEHPYNRLIRCKRCGWGATTEYQRGHLQKGAYTYIYCSNRRCTRKSIRQDRFEQKVEAILQQIQLSEAVHNQIVQDLDEWWANSASAQARVDESKKAAARDTEAALSRLLDLLLQEIIDEDTYRSKRAELDRELRQLRRTIEDEEHRGEHVRASIGNALHFAEVALDLFRTGESWLKRRIVEALGLSFLIDGGELEIEVHPAFMAILGLKESYTEPPGKGSGSTKRSPLGASILVGGPETSYLELLQITASSRPIERLNADAWRENQKPTKDLVLAEQ